MTTTPLSPPHSHTDQSADDSPKPDRVEVESRRFYHSHFRLATQTNEPKQSRTAQSEDKQQAAMHMDGRDTYQHTVYLSAHSLTFR